MKILMVCLGNICRSPMAEGILKNKISEHNLNVIVDSAGTGNYHVGENPDKRAIATAKQFGVDISSLKARQFTKKDFDHFDKIFVMDQSNLHNVIKLAEKDEHVRKVQLILDYNEYESQDKNVPDPWFGNEEGFVDVFNMLDLACEKIIHDIKKNY